MTSDGSAMRTRPSLLLVDDCIAERDFHALALETDFTIVTADRGDQAVALAVRERPDVVVLDVNMPGMDGWEACTALKCHPTTADTPVIILTGANDRDLTQHAIAVGASAILRKPCPAETLRATALAATAGLSL
jgi:CheY-like chemotaxis protein